MNIEKSTGLGNSGRFMMPNGGAMSPPASNIPFNYDKGINSQVLSTQATNQFQAASIVPVSLQDAKDACGENGVQSYNKETETNGNLGGTSNGNINSDVIKIKSTAEVEGVLNQKNLSIEEGAKLKIKAETY